MSKKLHPMYLLVLAAVVFLAACGASGPSISVEEAWVRPDPLWENAAGYFLITNDGNESDYLIEVRLEFADMSMVHETVMEGDVHKMLHRERVEVPAGGQVEFKPLSFHVMIMGLIEGLELGDDVTLVLVFEDSGEIEVQAELRQD